MGKHLQLKIVPSRLRTGMRTIRAVDSSDLLMMLTEHLSTDTLVRLVPENDYAELAAAREQAADFARVVVEIANHSRRPCPDCEGAGYTVEMETVEEWVPERNPTTGEYYEERGYYEQVPSPTQELCDTCHGGGELLVLSSRFVEELVEPEVEAAKATLAATEDDG